VEVLVRSLRNNGNQHPFYLLVISRDENLKEFRSRLEDTGIRIVSLEDLLKPVVFEMAIYYTPYEFVNALKPFLIRHLAEDKGYQKLIYLDCDIWVCGSFNPAWNLLDDYSWLLTPHTLHPQFEKRSWSNELSFANLGIYNGGLYGIRVDEHTLKMLEWLQYKLTEDGFVNDGGSSFSDQKYLPLLAHFLDTKFKAWRNPGANVAIWNVHERNLKHTPEGYFVNESPVLFFHFSGHRPEQPDMISTLIRKEINEYLSEAFPALHTAAREYSALLSSAKLKATRDAKYDFTHHLGWRLTQPLRRRYFVKRRLSIWDRHCLLHWLHPRNLSQFKNKIRGWLKR